MTTNIISPPDFVDDELHTILLVDTTYDDLATLAHLCSVHAESFNIYWYPAGANNLDWMNAVAHRADVILVNTEPNEFSFIKDRMAVLDKAYHYGPKNFLNNNRKYNTVLDYFIQRANERKHSNDAL